MKTLLVTIYDFSYYWCVYELTDEHLIKLDHKLFDDWIIGDIRNWSNPNREEYGDEIFHNQQKVEELFSNYDRVIVSEDGSAEIIYERSKTI